MGCIYLITCGNVEYVGSTANLLRRMKSHKSVLSLGRFGNSPLQIAFKEVGDFTYKVLEDDVLTEDLRAREQYWIDELKPNGNVHSAISKNPYIPKKDSSRVTLSFRVKEETLAYLTDMAKIGNTSIGRVIDNLVNNEKEK